MDFLSVQRFILFHPFLLYFGIGVKILLAKHLIKVFIWWEYIFIFYFIIVIRSDYTDFIIYISPN